MKGQPEITHKLAIATALRIGAEIMIANVVVAGTTTETPVHLVEIRSTRMSSRETDRVRREKTGRRTTCTIV